MATSIQAGFQIGNNEPADARISVADQTARLGFASDNVYEGLVVYQKDTDKLYVLVDASDHTVNSNWSEVVISGGGGTNLSGIFSGSFSGSFEGDGSGLTGVAPIAGDGILVTGTTVSVDSGSLIQTATNDSAYNVLFNNSTTPFAKDNTTSHFSYNPGLNQLQVSGSIIIGPSTGVSGVTSELKMRVSGSDSSSRIVFEKLNGNVEYAAIEIDNNYNLVNILDPESKNSLPEQSFLWRSSGSAAAGLVTRMELTGDSGNLTVYGSISGSSLETSGQVTIGTVNTADATVTTALVIDDSGNVQSQDLGNAAFQATGSMTVSQADTAGTATKTSKVETQTTDSTDTHHLTFVDSNNNSATGELIYTTGDITINPRNAGITAASVTASFKGDLDGNAATATTATNATSATNTTNINVASDSGNADHFVIFTDSGTGNNRPKSDAGLKYNPSTNKLTTTVTQADAATQVNIEGNSDSTTYNLVFTEAAGGGNGTLLVDDNATIKYNPGTDLLTVRALTVSTNATVSSNLTVEGDLTVNGTTTTQNTTNLDVEDAYILLRSGSGTVGDSGIIFGGSTGAAQTGSLLFWDASYPSNENEGRLAIKNEVADSIIGDQTADYYVAGVFIGSEDDAGDAQANHAGNIRIDTSGDIFIYVE